MRLVNLADESQMWKALGQSPNPADAQTFDIAVASVGYESRATKVSSSYFVTSHTRLAWSFSDRNVLAYEANWEWFKKANFELVSLTDRDFYTLLHKRVAEALERAPDRIRIGIDISCMTRTRIAVLLLAATDLHCSVPVEVHFFYSIAKFLKPSQGYAPNQHAGPVTASNSGHFEDPERPLAAVVGLGYEQDKALGAVELIEADNIWAMLPRSPIPEYESYVLRANEALLARVPAEKRLEYRVDDPVATFDLVSSLADGLMRSNNVIFLPFGPKIFFLVCMLRGVAVPANAVWRVSSGELESPSDREPSDAIVTCVAKLLPN